MFIPIDDHEKPVGDRCYVPEDFYSEIQRRAASSTADAQGWLLAGALYRGTLAWEAAPEKLSFSELKITYDLRVFGRRIRVRIPLGHEGVQMAPGGAVLEGRPIGLTWPAADGDLEFDVADPGQYRLELAAPDVKAEMVSPHSNCEFPAWLRRGWNLRPPAMVRRLKSRSPPGP